LIHFYKRDCKMKLIFSCVSLFLCISVSSSQYNVVQRGSKYSTNMRLYFQEKSNPGNYISAWHDISLYTKSDPTNQTLNMVVEIPRFTQAKFEINREHLLNPIAQDVEDNVPRYLPNLFPWHGHVCNYGAFPQTWENPFIEDEWTGMKGDKDPIDVCDVSSSSVASGTVLPVKVLGILAMLDSGETDWKVITMSAIEAEERGIATWEDLEDGLPETVREFFRMYKVPSGKPENEFAYNGAIKDKEMAMDVIKFTHQEWQDMIQNCSLTGTSAGNFNTHSPYNENCKITQRDAIQEVEKQPPLKPDSDLPADIDKWSFVKSSVQSGSESTKVVSVFLILVSLIFIFNAYI